MALSVPPPKSERRHRTPVSVSAELQGKIRSFAQELIEQYLDAFENPNMKTRVATILRRCLPPRPRPRGYPEVSRAIRMLDELRALRPEEPYHSLWRCIYPVVIAGYDAMNKLEKLTAR